MRNDNPIRKVRLAKGLRQDWVAAKAGISKQELCHVEHGRRVLMLTDLRRLARVLGVAVETLGASR